MSNPCGAGRPPVTGEQRLFSQLCRESADKVLRRLLKVVEAGKDADAIRAGSMILDRAFGPPSAAPISLPEAQRLDDVTPAQRVAIFRAALAKAEAEAEAMQ